MAFGSNVGTCKFSSSNDVFYAYHSQITFEAHLICFLRMLTNVKLDMVSQKLAYLTRNLDVTSSIPRWEKNSLLDDFLLLPLIQAVTSFEKTVASIQTWESQKTYTQVRWR